MRPWRIMAITGTRADYDLLYPVLNLLEERSDCELQLLATGAHLSREFGSTIEDVRRDKWSRLIELPSLLAWDQPEGRVISLATQLGAVARTVTQEESDLILVLGDREEPLLGATAGVYLNLPVAHIFGGDSGYATPDDKVRHAVTQLADLHFPVTERSRQRIIELGIDEKQVVCAGNPGLDRIWMTPPLDCEQLSAELGIELRADSYLMVTFHPLDRQHQDAADQMRNLLQGALATGLTMLVNTPNSDSGNFGVREVIREIAALEERVFSFSNLPRELYVNLLRNAACLIGNSSTGVLEAPFLRLPAVNVGERQRKREHVGNVVFVETDAVAIAAAVRQAISEKSTAGYGQDWQYHYGNGRAAEKIVDSIVCFMNERALTANRNKAVVQ